jgi:predicted Fe-S protein YdhL (DUF1289 family)
MRTILTPCIKICKIDPTTQSCTGCGRTLQQIKEWRIYTNEQRKLIMDNLKEVKEWIGTR